MRHISRTKRQDGFSLTELMIVIAVLIIIAAIAIPSFVSARKAAKQAKMLSFMTSFINGCNAFKRNMGKNRYPHYSELTATLPGQNSPLVALPGNPDQVWSAGDHFVVDSWYFQTNLSDNAADATTGYIMGFRYNGNINNLVPEDGLRYAVFEDGIVRVTSDGTWPTINSPKFQK